MVREVNWEKYVAAAFITAGIFAIGLLLGLVIEGKRVGFVNDLLAEQSLELGSSQLQYEYADFVRNENSCPALFAIINKNLVELDKTRVKLESYARNSRINDDSFITLKRQYTVEQMRYWILSREAKNVCDEDVVTLLYFYSSDQECPRCGDQEFILDYLKSLFGENLLIFAIDAQLEEEPLVPILKQQFGLTQYPSLIIESSVFHGFTSRTDIMSEVCSSYSSPLDVCEDEA